MGFVRYRVMITSSFRRYSVVDRADKQRKTLKREGDSAALEAYRIDSMTINKVKQNLAIYWKIFKDFLLQAYKIYIGGSQEEFKNS